MNTRQKLVLVGAALGYSVAVYYFYPERLPLIAVTVGALIFTVFGYNLAATGSLDDDHYRDIPPM